MGLENYFKWIKKNFFLSNPLTPDNARYFSINHDSIISNFTPLQRRDFYAMGFEQNFPAGETLFVEGDIPNFFYIILDGDAEVYYEWENESKGQSVRNLAVLTAGDVIGDMALVEDKMRSSSVKAKTDLKVLAFNLNDLSANQPVHDSLVRNMSKILSDRLRHTNKLSMKNMEELLEQSTARDALGIFMIALLWLMPLYSFSIKYLVSLRLHLTNSTPESVVLISIFCFVIITAMHHTGIRLSRFGITHQQWFKKTLEALYYTAYWMALFLLVKAYLIYFTHILPSQSLFSGMDECLDNGVFSLKFYLVMMALYAAFSPIQELITRSAMQSTFYYYLPGSETFRKWNSIALSNLLFALAHLYMGTKFALAVFIPGLFWGWLFHKQRSLIAVSVSHIVLGVWALFIVGAIGIL